MNTVDIYRNSPVNQLLPLDEVIMPPFGSISRRDLIAALHAAGFEGPYSGGKHQFMVRDGLRLRIPNPHQGDISQNLLARILKQAGIDREEWENL